MFQREMTVRELRRTPRLVEQRRDTIGIVGRRCVWRRTWASFLSSLSLDEQRKGPATAQPMLYRRCNAVLRGDDHDLASILFVASIISRLLIAQRFSAVTYRRRYNADLVINSNRLQTRYATASATISRCCFVSVPARSGQKPSGCALWWPQ
jgi:hypothetical protein